MAGKPRDLCPTDSSGRAFGSFVAIVTPPCMELSSNCAVTRSSSDPREENACYNLDTVEVKAVKYTLKM